MKTYSLILNDSFWIDLDEALEWYDNFSSDLGFKLENEVLKYCNKLSNYPNAYPSRWSNQI
jgi:hypothetical protein